MQAETDRRFKPCEKRVASHILYRKWPGTVEEVGFSPGLGTSVPAGGEAEAILMLFLRLKGLISADPQPGAARPHANSFKDNAFQKTAHILRRLPG
jgi:hypothetical protein